MCSAGVLRVEEVAAAAEGYGVVEGERVVYGWLQCFGDRLHDLLPSFVGQFGNSHGSACVIESACFSASSVGDWRSFPGG